MSTSNAPVPNCSDEERLRRHTLAVVERQTGRPSYLANDEEWAAAEAEARDSLPPRPAPMTGVRLACRLAYGGPFSDDSSAEREAYYAALALRREQEAR